MVGRQDSRLAPTTRMQCARRADGDPNPGTNESLNAAARAGSGGGQLYGNKKAGSPDSRLYPLRAIYRVLRDMHWKTIKQRG